MAVKYGSRFMTGLDNTSPSVAANGKLLGGRVRSITEVVEVAIADGADSTYYMGKIPSNAVILQRSLGHWDDLDDSGNAPTLDIGLGGSQITDDPNALSDGNDVKTAGSIALHNADIANIGKEAWEYVNGQTTDPGGLLNVYFSIVDDAVDTGGTLALELYYAER